MKPVILIFSARDEKGKLSYLLKDAINNIGSYSAINIEEDKYNRVNNNPFLSFYDDSKMGEDIRRKKHFKILDKKLTKLNKRDKRIIEAINRFKPVYVITTSPLSHEYVVEAKLKGKLNTPVLYYCSQFTVDKDIVNQGTNMYLVENGEAKETLLEAGLSKDKVKTIGLPYELKVLNHDEVTQLKQELGLPKSKVILLNLNDIESAKEILTILVDQGDMLSIGVHVEGASIEDFASIINRVQNVDVKMVEDLDKFLSVSDILITRGDTSVIYKAFSIEVPVIGIGEDQLEERDLKYLENHEAIINIKNNLDVVKAIYEILQTEKKGQLRANGKFLLSFSSIENIAEFLTNFLDFR